jgi:hypothetical protein
VAQLISERDGSMIAMNDDVRTRPDERSSGTVFGPGAAALADRFPRDFVWGVATSEYQVEGAAHEDGRGDSIWDEQGFDFHDRLVDGLPERGFAPYVTLYHWDLPQALQDSALWYQALCCAARASPGGASRTASGAHHG